MRDAIKLEVEADKSSKLPALKENRVVAKLAERLELDKVDEDYEQSVFSELGQNFLQNLSARGMTLDAWLSANGLTSEAFIADLHHQADDVARESLALDALARELKLEVTDEDIDEEFEERRRRGRRGFQGRLCRRRPHACRPRLHPSFQGRRLAGRDR